MRWVDVDSEGIVNNAVYLSLMEQARFAYFEHLALLTAGKVPFVLADARMTFVRPGRLGMEVVTAARVSRLGRSSFDMAYEVRGDAEVLVRSTAVLVFVGSDLRPVSIDPKTRAEIAAFEGLPAASADGPVG